MTKSLEPARQIEDAGANKSSEFDHQTIVRFVREHEAEAEAEAARNSLSAHLVSRANWSKRPWVDGKRSIRIVHHSAGWCLDQISRLYTVSIEQLDDRVDPTVDKLFGVRVWRERAEVRRLDSKRTAFALPDVDPSGTWSEKRFDPRNLRADRHYHQFHEALVTRCIDQYENEPARPCLLVFEEESAEDDHRRIAMNEKFKAVLTDHSVNDRRHYVVAISGKFDQFPERIVQFSGETMFVAG